MYVLYVLFSNSSSIFVQPSDFFKICLRTPHQFHRLSLENKITEVYKPKGWADKTQ